MDNRRLVHAWLMLGSLWFLLGITWTPSNKLYQQGLIGLFWLPTLLLGWSERSRLLAICSSARPLLLGVLALVGWTVVSALWSTAEEPVREIKRLLYVLLFLAGLMLVTSTERLRLVRLLQVAGFGLALAAGAALVQRYGLEGKPLSWRLEGLGLLDHPIIGGYVIGLAAVWWFCLPPRRFALRLVWGAGLLTLLVFMAMTQSRSVWVALLTTMLLMPFWRIGRIGRMGWVVGGLLLTAVGVGYWQFEAVITERGASFRPEILASSLQMIAEHPWRGLGLGSDYQVRVPSLQLVFDHSHNVFTHIAIELGVPGLLLWLLIWGGSFRIAWLQRETALGGALLSMLMFSTMALLFDGASLWNTPRPEWFLTWLPVGLALGLKADSRSSRGGAEPLCYHAGPSKS